MSWYKPEVEAAASATSRRTTSRSGGGSAARAQYRPASAALSESNFAPTQQLPRPVSARTLALPVAVEHEEECICTICTCHKHACPPTPRETHYPADMATEHRTAYSGKFVPAVRASAPDKWKPHDAVFEGISTNRADFPDHGPLPPRRSAPRSSMMDTGVGRNNVPFDDITTHKSDFPAHPLGARKSAAPASNNLTTLGPDDRDFSTEGRNAFPKHPLQPRRSKPPEEARSTIPFQGVSTAKQDYPFHQNPSRAIPKFRSNGFQSNPEDRDFSTEGRDCYTPKKLESCPAVSVAVVTKSRPGHVFVELAPGTNTYRRKPLW